MTFYADILAGANVFLGLLIATLQLLCFRQLKGHPWRPVKLAYALVGLYWAGIYLYILLPVQHLDPVLFGRIFIRPAYTITLAMMAVGAIVRYRSGNCE